MNWLNNKRVLTYSVLTCLVLLFEAYFLERSQFYLLITGIAILFACYIGLIKELKKDQLVAGQTLAVLFRLILLFAIPNLSDDYFRFIWDGQLLLNGVNPFTYLPENVTTTFPNKQVLLESMNSLPYYSVYPPVSQLVYFIGALFSPHNILGNIIGIRLLIISAEIGIIFLLPKMLKLLKLNPMNSLWYVLNPLVIIEGTGNLHLESIGLFFLLLAIYYLIKEKPLKGAVTWALAGAVKLIPLLLIPLVFQGLKWKRSLVFLLLVVVFNSILFWPFLNEVLWPNFNSSLNLYSAKFEFNASVYYLLREFFYWILGYNAIATIGLILPKLALIIMLIIMMNKRNASWEKRIQAGLFALTMYYFFALVVHPWYIISLVGLACFTKYSYPLVWSGLAFLSYSAYQSPVYLENMLFVSLEYGVLTIFIFREFYSSKKTIILDKN